MQKRQGSVEVPDGRVLYFLGFLVLVSPPWFLAKSDSSEAMIHCFLGVITLAGSAGLFLVPTDLHRYRFTCADHTMYMTQAPWAARPSVLRVRMGGVHSV